MKSEASGPASVGPRARFPCTRRPGAFDVRFQDSSRAGFSGIVEREAPRLIDNLKGRGGLSGKVAVSIAAASLHLATLKSGNQSPSQVAADSEATPITMRKSSVYIARTPGIELPLGPPDNGRLPVP